MFQNAVQDTNQIPHTLIPVCEMTLCVTLTITQQLKALFIIQTI